MDIPERVFQVHYVTRIATSEPPMVQALKTERSLRHRYQRIARIYDCVDFPFEWLRYRRIRPMLVQGLGGRILDAGTGTGRNLPLFPNGATVVGVDLSSAMLRQAVRRRRQARAPVHLAVMNIAQLGFPDSIFDAVVASFVLCTLPEAAHAEVLAELARVVKPGGCIRLLEYARSEYHHRRWVAKAWAPWVRFAFGARLDRRLVINVAAAGLELISRRCVSGDQVHLLELSRAW